ncbi:MAG: hypothetical protein H0S84_02055 [Bacteroidales bacterium]|jgi:hypothetical protein|nr:hypothetical protein [Bacteroidales bacterium]
MEDFIYILIGIIWLVFSVVKSNQKKKAAMTQNQQISEPQEAKDISFEDTIAEMFAEEPETVFQEVGEQESTIDMETSEPEVGMAYQSLEELYLKEQEEQIRKGEITKENSVKNRIEPETLEKTLDHHPFDLRRAIIYQAILERPYA